MDEKELQAIEDEWEDVPSHYRFEVDFFYPQIKALVYALRADRKATEKLAEKVAECDQVYNQKPEYWTKWAREVE